MYSVDFSNQMKKQKINNRKEKIPQQLESLQSCE